MYTDQPELERSVQDINKKQKNKRTHRKIENSIKEFFEEESLKNRSVFHNNECFSNINSLYICIYILYNTKYIYILYNTKYATTVQGTGG